MRCCVPMTSQRHHEMRIVSLINDAQIVESWLDDSMMG